MMGEVYLLIGSNIGNRELTLRNAILRLERFVGKIELKSSLYETEPWGMKDVRPFLNLALKLNTHLSPVNLLSSILRIELVLGRVREEGDEYRPRIIDIDIMFIDDKIITTKELTIPHPLMHRRRFVLEPLNEIAPLFVHPVFGNTIEELLIQCDDKGRVWKFND